MYIFLCYLLLLVCVLVSVAFFTLLERKVLSYIQIRKGPNKVGALGLLQPFSDGMKLFLKENSFMNFVNLSIYYFSPVFGLSISMLFWVLLAFDCGGMNLNYEVLMFFCLSSLGVYFILGSGWSSNSSYSILGGYRSVAQMISYEVSLGFILLILMLCSSSYSLSEFVTSYWVWILGLFLFPLFLVWLVSILAETNRSPFDFAEGESELVSGFNVEYGSGGFALIFIAEYMSIIFMSSVSVIIFFYGYFLLLGSLLLMYFFLWVRGSYPRFRYDELMMLAWKCYLPMVLGCFFFFYGLILGVK